MIITIVTQSLAFGLSSLSLSVKRTKLHNNADITCALPILRIPAFVRIHSTFSPYKLLPSYGLFQRKKSFSNSHWGKNPNSVGFLTRIIETLTDCNWSDEFYNFSWKLQFRRDFVFYISYFCDNNLPEDQKIPHASTSLVIFICHKKNSTSVSSFRCIYFCIFFLQILERWLGACSISFGTARTRENHKKEWTRLMHSMVHSVQFHAGGIEF